MKIIQQPGDKGEGDVIIRVRSDDDAVTHFEIGLLLNLMALNELRIKGNAIRATGRFFFKEMCLTALENAEDGVNWSEIEDVEETFRDRWNIPGKVKK